MSTCAFPFARDKKRCRILGNRVAAQDAERRPLERNIHDGAQQQLTAPRDSAHRRELFSGQGGGKDLG